MKPSGNVSAVVHCSCLCDSTSSLHPLGTISVCGKVVDQHYRPDTGTASVNVKKNGAEMTHLSSKHSPAGLLTLKPDLVMDSQCRRQD